MKMRVSVFSLIAMSLLAWLPASHAAEGKAEKMTSDQTQQTYKRKSMTYVGIGKVGGFSITDAALSLIEKAIRPGIELKRFDYNEVDIRDFGSLDAFVKALQEYVEKRAEDRAAAEAEYEARFKRARVYAKDFNRIMSSAYFYDIKVKQYRATPIYCYMVTKRVEGIDGKTHSVKEEKCQQGSPSSPDHQAYMEITLAISINFFRANLTDKTKKPYSVLATLKLRDKSRHGYASPPARPKSPKNATPEMRSSIQEQHRARQANYRKNLPQIQKRTALSGTRSMASQMSSVFSVRMRELPEFQLKTPVLAALSDGVDFMLGKKEGLALDDTFDVTEFDEAGKKSLIGYVKVRNIGDATGQGGGTPSYAEKVKEKRKFVGGEQLFEHPMMKLDVGFFGLVEFVPKHLLDSSSTDEIGLYAGGGFYVDYNLAEFFNWSEFYGGFVVDGLYLGNLAGDGTGADGGLVHAMVSLKKKWYIESLVIKLGLRGGLCYYLVDTEGQNLLLGGGGDLVLGFEYYFFPEFSLYLDLVGRFFTNPYTIVSSDVNQEMGAQANLGIRFGM